MGFLSAQLFRDRHSLFDFRERRRKYGGASDDRAQHLPWQEKTQTARADFHDSLSGHYQRTSGSSPACAAVFVSAACAGNADLSVYALRGLAVLLILFYWKGKSWRGWFQENMQNRSLRKSERYLLWVIGILMLLFANHTTMQIMVDSGNVRAADRIYGRGLAPFIGITSASAFVMTITIIVLIVQGNKRSFYHEKISHMQSGMVTFLAEVVENRDDNTGGHIRRTAKYVEMIAKELKERGAYRDILTEDYVRDMVIAAPLHDIGKIHIPDSILNKPGRLTEEEFAIMKTHAAAGRDLLLQARAELGEFSYLHMAIEMAEGHHEWWNGKGYPNGSQGEEIPLCARIMAVADVFDALTSKRCYKEAMPLEKAYAIIREESGVHFDPVVADAFLDKLAG